MAKYQLSPQAERSLTQISKCMLDNFGARQRKKYLNMLRQQMRDATANPACGRVRNEIKPGYYSLPAGKHHIYYRVRDAHIEVIDVLHQSMEPNIHL